MQHYITVKTQVRASLQKVWEAFTNPKHIVNWNFASSEWHAPSATVDFKAGGKFKHRMEAKDGSFGFDLGGTFTNIKNEESVEYALDDGRKVAVTFSDKSDGVEVIQMFEPETQNDESLQRDGWQAILNNFKAYAETL